MFFPSAVISFQDSNDLLLLFQFVLMEAHQLIIYLRVSIQGWIIG